MRLLRSAESDLSDIADLISRDSALVVDVLRCANSAYHGVGWKITAVGEAVQIIGFRETIRLLNLVAAHQTANRDLGSYGIAAEDFWAASLFSGLFLERLAERTGAFDAGEAYTAGLLRFTGRLAINQAIQDLGGGLFWDGKESLSAWELENVGITQAGAGAHLLRKWNFSDVVVQAVDEQERQDLDPSAESLVRAVNFAARVLPSGLDRSFVESLENRALDFPADHPFAVAHNLTPEDVNAVLADAQRELQSIRGSL